MLSVAEKLEEAKVSKDNQHASMESWLDPIKLGSLIFSFTLHFLYSIQGITMCQQPAV